MIRTINRIILCIAQATLPKSGSSASDRTPVLTHVESHGTFPNPHSAVACHESQVARAVCRVRRKHPPRTLGVTGHPAALVPTLENTWKEYGNDRCICNISLRRQFR